jgi:hypothetical protein
MIKNPDFELVFLTTYVILLNTDLFLEQTYHIR